MLEIDRRLVALENGSARQAMAAIANAWAQGDLDTLRRLFAPPEARGTLDRMAGARNPAIASRIDELHRGGQRVFAAAGILHMVGDGALQKLLAEPASRSSACRSAGARSLAQGTTAPSCPSDQVR